MFGARWNYHNNVLSTLSISLDSQKHRLCEQHMLWFESRKKLSGGLIKSFLSVLGVLQVEMARNLY